ncbi:hypothetical protein KBB96_14285 [Luteolibacter ambystomatis]|uniref:Uncharacterized protein n=1 Tax=Luteolibacter ambystomatis TaxID=2824561 RepID=A0A975G767_9BACT|nr:hypothetical protein [Luteolibacter ambystomatis]QUE50031.1 hypothetical protein KBB96_14285 [Luteolibacter ambystomatis]
MALAIFAFGCTPAPEVLPVKTRLENAGISGCERVVAYAINLDEKYPNPNHGILMDGRLNPSRSPVTGVTLSAQQTARLLDATIDFKHHGPEAMCFEPRHGLVFYRADGGIAAHCTICFHCRGLRSTGGRFSDAPDYDSLERLVQELGLPLK